MMSCSSSRHHHQLPDTSFIVGADLVKPCSLLFSLSRHRLHVDSDLSTRTTYQRLCRCAMLHCDRSGASVGQSPSRSFKYWQHHSSCRNWTAVVSTQPAPVCPERGYPSGTLVCSARKFDHVCCATCIGSEYLSRSRSGCQCLYTAVYIGPGAVLPGI